MSSRTRVVALLTAVLAGGATVTGVSVGTQSARADSSNGYHYVAFLRGDPSTNSVLLVNSVDGGTICYDVSSLTTQGGAYTTKYVVTNGKSVQYYKYHSNNCTYTTLYFESTITPGRDLRKYYYFTV